MIIKEIKKCEVCKEPCLTYKGKDMGCYDTVEVLCPKCGQAVSFQSKSGFCYLYEYTLDKAPDDVMSDINRHSPYECCNCRQLFKVAIDSKKAINA